MAGTFRQMGCLAACLCLLTALTSGADKKQDRKARLKSIETVLVNGDGPVASHVGKNLTNESCLKRMFSEHGADAELVVWQQTRPCEWPLNKLCVEVNARLIDRETGKLLWSVADRDFGSRVVVGVDEAAAKWVIWHLNDACCKGRK